MLILISLFFPSDAEVNFQRIVEKNFFFLFLANARTTVILHRSFEIPESVSSHHCQNCLIGLSVVSERLEHTFRSQNSICKSLKALRQHSIY